MSSKRKNDDEALERAIGEFRAAAFESVARPSAELASRLELEGASGISPETPPHTGRVTMASWIAGLGLAAKISLGAGVAVAATLAVAGGAGAAGILPVPAQETFDTVVSSIIPNLDDDGTADDDTEVGEPSPEPTSTEHPDNFGGWVSERAHDPNKDGHTFGTETSEAAQENGNKPDDAGTPNENSNTGGNDNEGGKPSDLPTGKPSDTPGGKPGK